MNLSLKERKKDHATGSCKGLYSLVMKDRKVVHEFKFCSLPWALCFSCQSACSLKTASFSTEQKNSIKQRLSFDSSGGEEKNIQFCFQRAVVGCPDWPTSPGVEAERARDRLLLRCKATQETVDLKCSDGKWEGKALNCTQGRQSFQLYTRGLIFSIRQQHSRAVLCAKMMAK